MKTKTFGKLAIGCLAATTLMACGADDKDGEPAAVSHQTATQSIEANSTSIAASLGASLQMLEDSSIFSQGVDATLSVEGDVACADFNDPANCESPEPEPVDLDGMVNEGNDALLQGLRDYIFVDANIETESTNEITYLLRGDVLCDSMSESSPTPIPNSNDGSTVEPGTDVVEQDMTECIDAVDAAEVRLRVTSPVQGDIDVAVFVGPQRFNPASFEFHQDLLAAEVDFAGAKGAIEHIADSLGEDAPELPTQMAGRVRAELLANGPESVTTTFSILTPIDIAHTDFSLQMAAASPASQVTIDGVAKSIEGLNNFGTVDLNFLSETYSETMDENGNWIEDITSTVYDIHLAGATGSALFDVAAERLELTGLGLGNGTATLSVDGAQALSVDLNANDGRTLDATITKAGMDDVLVEVSPLFDLELGLDFQNLPDANADLWAQNEVMTILLNGDVKPALLFGANGVEVIRGKLTMGLANEGSLLEANPGQCLLDVGSEPPVEGTEPVETNPIDELQVGFCE